MRRLSEDIEQQVASLNDVVSTLDELYRRSAEEQLEETRQRQDSPLVGA